MSFFDESNLSLLSFFHNKANRTLDDYVKAFAVVDALPRRKVVQRVRMPKIDRLAKDVGILSPQSRSAVSGTTSTPSGRR